MLTQMFPFLDPTAVSSDLVSKLRALADDCERLCRRRGVSPFVLDAAPRLDDWVAMQTPLGIQLIGQVSGHPLLGDRAAVTSPLWIADPQGRWVRTLSRFYQLAAPADPADIHRVMASTMGASGTQGDGDDGSEEEA
jgi:hypothetical protein